MTDKIRLGFVGANVNSTWAGQSHFPALLASPDVEFTAVCTTRPESAEEARVAFGAKLAFHDFREMAASPEIDAVAVVVRVPSHYEPTRAAIEAGKHVLTEWPLGRTTAEAEELTDLAQAKGVQTAVGLQSRVSPALMYVKDMIDTGYVGEVMTCTVTTFRDGPVNRQSGGTWQRDPAMGANTLTIATGHVIDALRFVLGDFKRVACMVTNQVGQWYEIDTQQYVDVMSPDNVRVSGELARGAAASDHVGAVALGRQRVPHGDLRPRRYVDRHRQRVVAARRDAADTGGAGKPRAGRPGDPPAVLVRAGRLPPGRSVQRRAVVCPVRGRRSGRARPVACQLSIPPLASIASSIPSSRRPIRAGSCR